MQALGLYIRIAAMKTWLLIFGICAGFTQPVWPEEQYLQIRRDYTDAKYNVKFFEGEIYRGERPNKDSSWKVRYGNLKIELPYIGSNRIYEPLGKARVEAMRAKEEDLKNKLEGLIKKQVISGKDKYLFDLKAIKKNGQRVIFATNQAVALIFESKDLDIISDFDKTFADEYIRVIVPQAPTMFIEKAAIHNAEPEYLLDKDKYTELISKDGNIYLQQKDGRIFLTDKKYASTQPIMDKVITLNRHQILKVDDLGLGTIDNAESQITLWEVGKFLIFSIGSIAIIFLLVIFLMHLKVRFGSAPQSGPPAVSRKKTSGFKEFWQSTFSRPPASDGSKILPQQESANPPAMPSSFTTPGKFSPWDDNILEQWFKVLESSITRSVTKEIKNLEKLLVANKNDELLAENDRLQRQVDTLNQKLSTASLENEFAKKELLNKERELNDAKLDLEDKRNQLAQYGQAARTIDELKQYVYPLPKTEALLQRHLAFFSSLQDAENKVLSLLSRSPAGADADHILMMWSKYVVKKSEIPVVRWEAILNGMKDRAILTDRELIRRLKVEKNDEQRWRILSEQLYKDVYLRWLSTVLVLMEEVRNLERFTGGQPTLITEGARSFDREILRLCNQAEQTLEIIVNYVRLFDDYTQYSNIRAVDEPVYLFYRTSRLQRDCIHQIVSYGLKSPYGNEPTTVILAK